jgi:hypothetical protein
LLHEKKQQKKTSGKEGSGKVVDKHSRDTQEQSKYGNERAHAIGSSAESADFVSVEASRVSVEQFEIY